MPKTIFERQKQISFMKFMSLDCSYASVSSLSMTFSKIALSITISDSVVSILAIAFRAVNWTINSVDSSYLIRFETVV